MCRMYTYASMLIHVLYGVSLHERTRHTAANAATNPPWLQGGRELDGFVATFADYIQDIA